MPHDLDRLPKALADYLHAVGDELSRRAIPVREIKVRGTQTRQALSGSVELDQDLGRAIWHEELGWWVELGHGASNASPDAPRGTTRETRSDAARFHRSSRRPATQHFLPGELVPHAMRVGEFIARVLRGDFTASAEMPIVHRYRQLADDPALYAALVNHTPTVIPCSRSGTRDTAGSSENSYLSRLFATVPSPVPSPRSAAPPPSYPGIRRS